jgi:5'-phosphate synthase pdxT subunit
MKMGVLALQGDYEAHAQVLEKLNQEVLYVRQPNHLQAIDGLIIPGGESTTLLKHLLEDNFSDAIKQFAASGKFVFGTCAGAILLSKEVINPVQPSLGLIDITIERNSYGRQLASCLKEGRWFDDTPMPLFFIRAPKIKKISPRVNVLATFANEPMCVVQDNCLVSTFHPELSSDFRVHQYFIECIQQKDLLQVTNTAL